MEEGMHKLVALCLLLGGISWAAEKAAKPSVAPKGKHYTLAATMETVQWGWLDPNEKPKLTVSSGDTISIETMMHADDAIQPGKSIDDIVKLRKDNPGGGPHSVTGPIFVQGAEPGDVMEIRILKIVGKDVGTNFHLPGKEFPTIGLLASDFPTGFVRFYKLDWRTRTTELKPGVVLDLKPFPGILAVWVGPHKPKGKGGAPVKAAERSNRPPKARRNRVKPNIKHI